VQNFSPESPEARRKRLAIARARVGKSFQRVKPGTRTVAVVKRVAIGVYSDGFIHAGNLAYLALLTIFPVRNRRCRGGTAVRRVGRRREYGTGAVPDDAAERAGRAAPADPGRAAGPLRESALARCAGRPVDDGQLHRDDPRRDPPRLRRAVQPPLLGISAGLARHDLRVRVPDPDRLCFSVFLSSAEQFVSANLPGGEDIAQIFTWCASRPR
jgi:hypothetical protein